jgi:hypothetical protein
MEGSNPLHEAKGEITMGTGTYIMRKGMSSLNDLVDGYSAIMAVASNVFYVDALHANKSNGNEGKDPNKPLLTIAQAYANCGSNGDTEVIFVKGSNRYRENELVCEKDNIKFIGAGWATQWNRTSSQTGDYVLKVHGVNGVEVHNIQLSGTDLTEDVLYFGEGTTGDSPAHGVVANCLIRNAWYTATPAGTSKAITLVSPTFMKIQDNFIYSAGIGIDITDGSEKTSHAMLIERNKICVGSYGIKWVGYGYTSEISDNLIWDWLSTVNLDAGIYLNLNSGGCLVANNKVGALVPFYDAGDLNYFVGNQVRATEAASEDFALSQENWC